jgi:hypothetical protein
MSHIQPIADLEAAFHRAVENCQIPSTPELDPAEAWQAYCRELRAELLASEESVAEFRAIACDLVRENRELRQKLDAALHTIHSLFRPLSSVPTLLHEPQAVS